MNERVMASKLYMLLVQEAKSYNRKLSSCGKDSVDTNVATLKAVVKVADCLGVTLCFKYLNDVPLSPIGSVCELYNEEIINEKHL